MQKTRQGFEIHTTQHLKNNFFFIRMRIHFFTVFSCTIPGHIARVRRGYRLNVTIAIRGAPGRGVNTLIASK